uniref:Uncharacterized protein n=1 Tax=Streptomyces sp. NBC_01401 TaxID=2903854 RepID=A0AAU3GKM9_9ACTN
MLNHVRRRWAVTIAVAGSLSAGLLAAGGCSQGDSPSGRVRQALHVTGEAATLDVAEQLLERDCLEKQGFRFWVVPKAPARRSFPYVVDDIAWARKHGYGSRLRADLEKAGSADPNRTYFGSLPPDRRAALAAALNGPRPTGLRATLPSGIEVSHSDQGCTAEAERRLYRDLPAWFRATRVTDNLGGARAAMVVQDERYREAATRWKHCMRGKGYAFKTPAQSAESALRPSRGFTHEQEIRLAVTEAGCAHGSDLSRVAASLDREYGARLRERYSKEVGDLARLRREALPRARAVIARG